MLRKRYSIFILIAASIICVLILAFSLDVLIGVTRSPVLSRQMLKDITGLHKLESRSAGAPLPLNDFSSYDQANGTNLFYLASQLPSIQKSQIVTSADIEKLQLVAESQLEKNLKMSVGYGVSFVIYLWWLV